MATTVVAASADVVVWVSVDVVESEFCSMTTLKSDATSTYFARLISVDVSM